MTYGSDEVRLGCPYCGEVIVVVVDLSVEQQEYVEDCSVCCRPMLLHVTAGEDDVSVSVRREDD